MVKTPDNFGHRHARLQGGKYLAKRHVKQLSFEVTELVRVCIGPVS
jgi:hypothetical protein